MTLLLKTSEETEPFIWGFRWQQFSSYVSCIQHTSSTAQGGRRAAHQLLTPTWIIVPPNLDRIRIPPNWAKIDEPDNLISSIGSYSFALSAAFFVACNPIP